LAPSTSANAYQFPLITFLSRYRDFLALYSLASQRAAASTQELTEEETEEIWRMKSQSSELLILLLTSGMAPKSFWAIMLLDSVGLLESKFCPASVTTNDVQR
jgi:nuclear pore complex protein Nup85